MADKHAAEVIRSLHGMGFVTRTDPTARFATKDAPGRADIMAAKNGRVAFIEVKNGAECFSLDLLTDRQREWAEQYCIAEPFCNPYWIWFLLGKDPPNRDPERYMPRRAWIVPYPAWLEMEHRVRPVQATLVYAARKGMRREIQEQNLDALHLLAGFEVSWESGRWNVPREHPFAKIYLSDSQPQPLYLETGVCLTTSPLLTPTMKAL